MIEAGAPVAADIKFSEVGQLNLPVLKTIVSKDLLQYAAV